MTGFLNVYKPAGMSSAAVVNRVKRLVKTPCGHMGTLDPLAEGVLPVGVGNATRLFDYFLQKRKRYTARFRFGATTDTLDAEGEVIVGGRVPPFDEIGRALPAFIGEIEQIPPRYSAVSVGGRRGYDLARAGAEFELAPKNGTKGYMTFLRRDASGVFTAETAVALDALNAENAMQYLIPTDMVLPFPALDVQDGRIFQGVRVPVEVADGQYKLYRGGEFYGLARVEEGLAHAEKKLC